MTREMLVKVSFVFGLAMMVSQASSADETNLALGKNYGWTGREARNVKADPGDPDKVVRCETEGRKQLTDGYHGQAAPNVDSTVVWGGMSLCRGVEVVIDLGKREGFDKIRINLQQNVLTDRTMFPMPIVVFVSDDDKHFEEVARLDENVCRKEWLTGPVSKFWAIDGFHAKGRYVKVMLCGQPAPSLATFIYCDEIEVLASDLSVAEKKRLAEATQQRIKERKKNVAPPHKPPPSEHKRGFVLFNRPVFTPIITSSVPRDTEIIDRVSLRACRGEYEPLNFAIHALDDMKDIQLSVTSRGFPGTLNLDVVKVWKQSDRYWSLSPDFEGKMGLSNGIFVDVPELLLDDDRIELVDPKPDVPRSPVVRTDIPASTSKQFWLTACIDDKAKSGTYPAQVDIRWGNGRKFQIPVSLTVLPFNLADSGKVYGTYYLTPDRESFDQEDLQLIEADLHNMREHGLNTMKFHANSNPLQHRQFLAILKKLGYTGPFMSGFGRLKTDQWDITEPFLETVKIAREFGFEVLWYLIDEPHGDRAKLCKQWGADMHAFAPDQRTVTALSKRVADFLGEDLDVPNYSLYPDAVEYARAVQEGRMPKSHSLELFYWTSHPDNCMFDRLYNGFYLWKLGFDGTFPWAWGDSVGDPIYAEAQGTVSNATGWSPTYPSKQGPINTLWWEAYREGIDDARYIQTLLVEAKRVGKQADAQALIDEILSHVDYYVPVNVRKLRMADVVAWRDQIIDRIRDYRKTKSP